jgi:hypothetical protein
MPFTLIDNNRDREKTFNTRAEAEEKKQDMIGLGASPEDLEIVSDASDGAEQSADTNTTEPKEPASDGGQTAEVVQEPTEEYDLPDEGPSVDTDPLVWMPDEFTDVVDGTVTINRKGFEVLAHHYDVSGGTEMVVSPVETDMAYAVHKATVTDSDGEEYTAYGEAHASDNGEENIVRMSDTRAYKRAVSRATGVGTIAIEELQDEL